MKTTKIYKDYSAFLNRENKDENGVCESFALENPNYQEDNETNKACWNCIDCSDCSYCRSCSSCSDCSYCRSCSSCSYCSDCSYCSSCSDCSYCRSCSYCSYCRWEEEKEGMENKDGESFKMVIPKIENIHQKVLEAVSAEGALDMSTWHKDEKYEEGAHCGTTHCRAGWVVMLAGKAGRELEKQTNTEFAAKHIYKESSSIHVSPTMFYVKNEESMEDIKRCAEEELKLNS
jgi:hypothetical protein